MFQGLRCTPLPGLVRKKAVYVDLAMNVEYKLAGMLIRSLLCQVAGLRVQWFLPLMANVQPLYLIQ